MDEVWRRTNSHPGCGRGGGMLSPHANSGEPAHEQLFIGRSAPLRQPSAMRLIPLTLLMVLAASAAPAKGARRVWSCMNVSETREAVAAHRLIEPMRAVRSAEKSTRAEPLHSRLCQSHEMFIYELTLLRRDGKVIRLFMNAANGVFLKHKARAERGRPKIVREKRKLEQRIVPPVRERRRAEPRVGQQKPEDDRTGVKQAH